MSRTPTRTSATAKGAAKQKDVRMKKSECDPKQGTDGDSPARRIDARIEELGDWRGATLARVRMLVKEADPEFERLLAEEEAIERSTRQHHETPKFHGDGD